MGAAQKQHAQPALADAAADGAGQLAGQQRLVEGQGPAVVAAGLGQLAVQALGADPDAHAAQLVAAGQRVVPEQQVAVQVPVVVVGGAAVVGLAAAQRPADLHQEGGAVLLDKGVLALLGGQGGVEVFQLLAGDEGDAGAVEGQLFQLGEHGVQVHLGGAHRRHDAPHHAFQVVEVAVLLTDDLFPVPLVHIDRVEVVQLLVPADGVHVAVQALAHMEVVVLQSLALPLGQGLDHLGGDAGVLDVEGDLALHAVQVVVQAGGGLHEQGGRDAAQVQRRAQGVGKQPLDRADGPLGVVQVQGGRVARRQDDLAHNTFPFVCKCAPRAGTQWILQIIAQESRIVKRQACNGGPKAV